LSPFSCLFSIEVLAVGCSKGIEREVIEMEVTSLSAEGKIVIPKKLRKILRLRPGTKFTIELEGNRLILRPMKGDVARRLYGRYKGLDLLKDLEEEHLREAKDLR